VQAVRFFLREGGPPPGTTTRTHPRAGERGQRSPVMTHFRDVAARGAFPPRHASRRRERPSGARATRVCVARIRATSSCMNPDMIVNLAT
jgi:hypothetical protein